ncbi:hypothetical protein DRN73_06885 [Candidatus Pacearchaeota archaeon]|nr:MAG: hypothetical protein DRN73_06885 [Candidatus Pacearchaeota archaeon]
MVSKKLLAVLLGLFLVGVVSAWGVEITSPVQDAQYGEIVNNITWNLNGINQNNLSSCWYNLNGGSNLSFNCDDFYLTQNISSIEGNNTWKIFAKDINNITESDEVDFWVDSIYPNITINIPTEPDYFSNPVIPFNVDIYELNPKDVVYFSVWKLNAPFPSWSWAPELNSGLNNIINSTNPMSSEGLYSFNVSVSDVMEHTSEKGRWVYVDMTSPYYSNPQNQSDNIYAPGKSYSFNITWQDATSGIDNVSFILDGNSYSVSSLGGDVYSVVVNDLSAGNHIYSWNASDKAGNPNSTGNLNYYVEKATPLLNLNANSWNINYTEESNVSGINCPNQLTCNLYRNNTLVSIPDTKVLGASNYLYIYNTSGNQNYTSASVNKTLIVNRISPEFGMIISGTSPIVYGNASDFQGTETNTGDAGCNYFLYANGENVSNPDNTIYGVGSYTYVYNTSGCQNYTAGSVSGILEVTKASRSVNMFLSPNTTIIYGNYLNVSCEGDSLLRNQTDVSSENNQNVTLAAGVYHYVCNLSGNENYTDAINESDIVVEKALSSIKLYLNESEDNISVEQYTNEANVSINATRISGESNITVYIDSLPAYLGNPNILSYNLFISSGLHNITAIIPESENYSSSSKTLWVNVSDTTPPEIKIYSPNESTTYSDNYIDLNVTANEDSVNWSYNLNNGTNVSFTPNTTIYLGNGDYNMTIYAQDSSGNLNFSNLSFVVYNPPRQYSSSGGSCKTIYNCTLWTAWSSCENGQQNRTCLKWERVNCGKGIRLSDLKKGEIRNCTIPQINEPEPKLKQGEPIIVNNTQDKGLSPITGGAIGFLKSRGGIATIITVLVLLGALGIIRYKRKSL